MVERRSDDGGGTDESPKRVLVRRRHRVRRILGIIGLSLLLLLLVAIAAIWIARRPIASNVMEREFERRGVQATYELERVGLRTQVVRNLVIGDPEDPDLFARYALIQLRVRWNGSVEVYRIVARGVRLEGRVVDGRVVWGDVSKLLPPPSDQPFAFPDITVDVANSSISLQTPFGPLGFALEGSGNLTGGFEGRLAVASPRIVPGRCEITDISGLVGIEITARRPHVVGPVAADRFACPRSRLLIERPVFNIDSEFSESFTNFEGRGQMAARRMIAGENGLAQFIGNISFEGSPEELQGQVDLAARQSRLGPVVADRTRVVANYELGTSEGRFELAGKYSVQDATLAESMLAGVAAPLAAAANTPIGPIATAMARAIRSTASSFDASGELRVLNSARGGAAHIASTVVRADNGARLRLFGGEGVTYFWPSGRIRIDGQLEMRGGGLPTGRITLRQQRPGGPLSGVARFEPYRVGASRLALEPVRFEATPAGATQFSTVAQLDGPFEDGAVRGLRLPINGRLGADGSLTVGPSCIVASWTYFRMRELQLGPTRLPICPVGPAILYQPPGGSLRINARIDQPNLQGRLGDTPLRVNAASARITEGRDFALTNVDAGLGEPGSGLSFDADRLQGTFRGSGITGTFTDAEATIGDVPLLISEADGDWQFYQGDLTLDGNVTVSDRNPDPRFYPLRSDDFRLTMEGNDIRAGGTLRHPDTGTRVTDVTVRHDLGTGAGGAVLDVPGITFGDKLQPEDLTRLTEGVVALVEGTVRGQGRINWDEEGDVTSTGEFTTVNMDLAAPFGPVQDLTTTIQFTDLLGLETAPGQTATVGSINPGILVEDGVITYQLLSDQRVRIERGVWPFMGGTLILHETILNFARPTAKRLTFEVVGLNARVFVETLGIEPIQATGTFDGVLPMIFDDAGGRIVGGRLEARPPGGTLAYVGEIGNLGLVGGLAFDALKELHYRDMVIRLDGQLDGEFVVRMTIDNIALGDSTIASILRAVARDLRFKFNITIRGPLRNVIQTVNSLEDPTGVIAPVMPFPLDAPGIVTETRRIEKETESSQPPTSGEFEVTTEPATESER